MTLTSEKDRKPSPAAQRALRLLAEQRRLADEVDAALVGLSVARAAFVAHIREFDAGMERLAGAAGFEPQLFSYAGAERLRIWLRDRPEEPGFAAFEAASSFDSIEQSLSECVGVLNEAE
jgi:hypothetical protein